MIKVWEDIWFAAVGEPGEYSCTVRLYDVDSFDSDGNPAFSDYSSRFDVPLDKVSTIPCTAELWIKWDGCCELLVNQTHFCRRHQVLSLGDALTRCWDMASELVKEWSRDVAE